MQIWWYEDLGFAKASANRICLRLRMCFPHTAVAAKQNLSRPDDSRIIRINEFKGELTPGRRQIVGQ